MFQASSISFKQYSTIPTDVYGELFEKQQNFHSDSLTICRTRPSVVEGTFLWNVTVMTWTTIMEKTVTLEVNSQLLIEFETEFMNIREYEHPEFLQNYRAMIL